MAVTTEMQNAPHRPQKRQAKNAKALTIEQRLVAAARKEFIANGYGGTSMAAIVKTAGMSKETLYSRFPSKKALFHAIIDSQLARFKLDLEQMQKAECDTLEKQLRLYADYVLKVSLTGELLQINRLIYGESNRFPELGQAAFTTFTTSIKQVAEYLRKYEPNKIKIRMDAERIAEPFLVLLNGWYLSHLFAGRKVPASERKDWIERVLEIFLASRSAW